MSFRITYQALFEVNILHNYFLNDGVTKFSNMTAVEQKQRLKLNDVSHWIDICPSPKTLKIMTDHHLKFKKTKTGFAVYAKIAENITNTPFIEVSDDVDLTFILKTSDRIFGNYTNLTMGETGLFYFGNAKPSTVVAGFKYIPKNNAATLISNAYQLLENGSKSVMGDLQGVNKIGIFGVIQLRMIGDSADLSILTAQGKLRVQPQIFKIHFDNRATFWRYKKASDDTEMFTTTSEKPLTKYGFIEIMHNGDKFPNPTANHLIQDTNTFFSEIYI